MAGADACAPRRRVLVVDDQATLRALLRFVLERKPDFEVVGEAEDGERCIQIAPSLCPDLVLLDLSMPSKDGLETLVELKRCMPWVRVVVLSGFSRDKAEALVLQLGANAYLEKGMPPSALVAALRAIAAQPPAQARAPVGEDLLQKRLAQLL